MPLPFNKRGEEAITYTRIVVCNYGRDPQTSRVSYNYNHRLFIYIIFRIYRAVTV